MSLSEHNFQDFRISGIPEFRQQQTLCFQAPKVKVCRNAHAPLRFKEPVLAQAGRAGNSFQYIRSKESSPFPGESLGGIKTLYLYPLKVPPAKNFRFRFQKIANHFRSILVFRKKKLNLLAKCLA